jgi:hypothetical protein
MKILQKDNVSIDEMLELTKETLRTLDSAGQRAILKHMIEHPNEVASFTGETTYQNRNPASKEVQEKILPKDVALYKQLLQVVVLAKNIDKRELLELLNVSEVSEDNRAFALIRTLNMIEAFGTKYGVPLIRWKIYVAKINKNGTFSYKEMSWGY